MIKNGDSRVRVYTDGGARGNPGPAAIGYVIYDQSGAIVASDKRAIGETTNNQAEYRALAAALRRLLEDDFASIQAIDVYSDSQLMVRQIEGTYRIKDPGLGLLLDEVKGLLGRLPSVVFHEIARSENRVADRLVNEALDGQRL